jgi:hypothetical protein
VQAESFLLRGGLLVLLRLLVRSGVLRLCLPLGHLVLLGLRLRPELLRLLP